MRGGDGRQRVGEHAIVLGASLAGLATAATLAGRFDRVSVVERDALPAVGRPRRGVPQGRHAHLMLPAGLQALTELVPGFEGDLRAHGAHRIPGAELRFYLGRGRLAVRTRELAVSGATRPLLEGVVRERVRALPAVEFREGCEVIGLVTGPDRTRVTGVRTGTGAGELPAADLVVDTTGRGSHAPRWLAELGCPAPAQESLRVDVRYSTRLFRRDPGDLGGCRHVVVVARPGERRGGLLLAVEGDRWLLTLVGLRGERPPTDLTEFVDYARSLWQGELGEVAGRAEPIGDAATGSFPSYLRHRYDRLAHLPAGFAVGGDAVCSFSPLHGQGMTVAVLQARALGEVLDRHGLDRVGVRTLKRTRPLVDAAWSLSTGADLADPGVDGPRPLSWRLLNAYLGRMTAVAHHDPVVAAAAFAVTGLVDPPTRVLRPGIVARVLGRRGPSASGEPDPAGAARGLRPAGAPAPSVPSTPPGDAGPT